MTQCPICDSSLNSAFHNPQGQDIHIYDCPRCGKFEFTGSLNTSILSSISTDAIARVKLSHAIRTLYDSNEVASLDTRNIEEILARPLPRPKEQADLLVRWIAENVKGFGEQVIITSVKHQAIIGATSGDGLLFIINHLINEGTLEGKVSEFLGGSFDARVKLSFKGWESYEHLVSGSNTYKRAFIALKYGDDVLDEIVKKYFKPAVKETGFELVRIDQVLKAGLIDNNMRVEIQASDFVLADLTHSSLGAYWEAGYAEGLGKPVFYLCEKSQFEEGKTHFDTNHHLTILWEKDNPQQAAQQLKAAIRATLPKSAQLIDSN